jgi:HSP20 family protein
MSAFPATTSTPAATRDGQVRYISPRIDIVETDNGYLLTADLPGVSKDQLEITIESGELSIIGHRDFQNEGEPLYRERRPYGFRRVFELDHSIDSEKISASLENGVLRLDLPKTEEVKPRKIEVA